MVVWTHAYCALSERTKSVEKNHNFSKKVTSFHKNHVHFLFTLFKAQYLCDVIHDEFIVLKTNIILKVKFKKIILIIKIGVKWKSSDMYK